MNLLLIILQQTSIEDKMKRNATTSSILIPRPTPYSDQPKGTTFASAKSRMSTKNSQQKSSVSTTRTSSTTGTRSTSRSRSSGRSIHLQLYDKSIVQQEEGKKRRHEVEGSLQKRAAERSGKFACNHKNCDHVYHHREHNSKRRENLTRELSKQKSISICDAHRLYDRLLSHKQKTNDKREQLKKDREARDMEWLNRSSKTKITVEDANRIYYRGTVLSRSRSRGRGLLASK